MNKRTKETKLNRLALRFDQLEEEKARIDEEMERVAKKMRILEETPLDETEKEVV